MSPCLFFLPVIKEWNSKSVWVQANSASNEETTSTVTLKLQMKHVNKCRLQHKISSFIRVYWLSVNYAVKLQLSGNKYKLEPLNYLSIQKRSSFASSRSNFSKDMLKITFLSVKICTLFLSLSNEAQNISGFKQTGQAMRNPPVKHHYNWKWSR